MFEAKPQPADATAKMALGPFDRGAAGENPFAVQHELQEMMQDQGAPDENQRTQKQTIRLDHPLHIHHCRVKATLHRGQSDVDDCTVDECHAGTENRCSENPWSGSFSTRDFATP